jgi:hypothetical protein
MEERSKRRKRKGTGEADEAGEAGEDGGSGEVGSDAYNCGLPLLTNVQHDQRQRPKGRDSTTLTSPQMPDIRTHNRNFNGDGEGTVNGDGEANVNGTDDVSAFGSKFSLQSSGTAYSADLHFRGPVDSSDLALLGPASFESELRPSMGVPTAGVLRLLAGAE